jgi:DNA-binding LytR/AlgR family response regulator
MILVRKALFIVLLGEPYTFFGDVLRESFYEYRKDAATYATFVLMLHLFRSVAEYKREAEAARLDAKKGGRITLKSGGRRIILDASAVEWARAADNYVEVKANNASHLARITLAALEAQLRLAGVDAARVPRSYVVNQARISEIIPSGDGDFRIRMSDGSELRGSRRYRDNLNIHP